MFTRVKAVDVLHSKVEAFWNHKAIKISWWTFSFADDDGGSQFLCEVRDSKENSTLDQAGFQLSCISWFPLPQGGALSVKLQFDAASVPLEAASRVVTFAIISRPYDSAQNPEAEMNDNIINLESRKALVADLQVIG